MAEVQPFRGLRYNPERAGDISAVISPPYDIISPQEQTLLYRRSPYNVIRLELGRERPGDSAENNKYTRAAWTLRRWLKQAILIREQRPALYLIEHRFPYEGAIRSRWGLTARIRLQNSTAGQVRLHEMTMVQPASDRLRLLESCRVNLSPVMGLFHHQGEWTRSLFPDIAPDRPDSTAVDSYGITYNMWAITNHEAIARVSDFFADKVLYIADGHHRYETALAYQRHQRSAHSSYSGNEAFDFVMMALTCSEDPNLIVLPTHRLVSRLELARLSRLREELGSYFDEELLSPQPTLAETLKGWLASLKERGRSRATLGLYGLHGRCLCLLGLRHHETLQGVMPKGQPPPLRDLDVNLLHWLILRPMLGIDSPEKEENCLEYARDGVEALSRVDSGECQLAFLLNPAPISSVLAVADAGARMPPKSTYFYPKTATGLVLNPLWGD